MATDNRDVKFWRYLAALHEAQAANLRKRAVGEDEDCRKCLERAKQADLAGPALPEPKSPPALPPKPIPAAPGAKQGKQARRG